jgi:hypothetical protein
MKLEVAGSACDHTLDKRIWLAWTRGLISAFYALYNKAGSSGSLISGLAWRDGGTTHTMFRPGCCQAAKKHTASLRKTHQGYLRGNGAPAAARIARAVDSWDASGQEDGVGKRRGAQTRGRNGCCISSAGAAVPANPELFLEEHDVSYSETGLDKRGLVKHKYMNNEKKRRICRVRKP